MQRKEFLQKGLSSLGFIAVTPLMSACLKTIDSNTPASTNGNSAANCTVTPSETIGPFPTKNPTSWVRKDITSGRAGTPLAVNITIKNKNNNCTALEGALVDIWHCDADGNYSEYGGSGMQSTNYTAVSFLRGRQTTNANGLVAFATIFPGWYSGRAVHIHVHIYDKNGKSLLVTQIAFPVTVCDAVFTTATTIYKKGKADTTNEKDNVFSDGFANEMASVTGTVAAGYVLDHTIVVNA
jgi:protocatechuate 3,4-dioxygenase beta subunit